MLGVREGFGGEPTPGTKAASAMLGLLPFAFVLGSSAPPTEDSNVLEPSTRALRGNQLAIDLGGGSMNGRGIGQSFVASGRLTYYPIRQLGIGAVYSFSRGLGGVSTADGDWVHAVHGQLELPLISALRVGRHKVLPMDLFGQAGAGAIHLADRWQALGVIGGGVRIYTRIRWLAVRVDALTYLHDTRREVGRPLLDTEVAFTLSATILLPRRPAIGRPAAGRDDQD